MRVLILGPRGPGGSLPPYLDALADGLAAHAVPVDRLGTTGVPYDAEHGRFHTAQSIEDTARELLADVALADYDLISWHTGNLETEQLVASLLPREVPPVVAHGHTLAPTLFRHHVPDPARHHAVQQSLRRCDGYIDFGDYARQQLATQRPPTAPAGIAWLPTTIPPGTAAHASPALAEALTPPDGRPLLTLYGYAAPWKDAALLTETARRMRVPARVLLAGPLWDQPDQAGCDLHDAVHTPRRCGAGELLVLPGYLSAPERRALVEGSRVGVFPYHRHPSFQGSGAIADYLAHGRPIVATDVANMAELAGPAGFLVPPSAPDALARALDTLAGRPDQVDRLTAHAHARAPAFTATAHASACLTVYETASRGVDPGTRSVPQPARCWERSME